MLAKIVFESPQNRRLKFTMKFFFVEATTKVFNREREITVSLQKRLLLKCLQTKNVRDNTEQVCFFNTGSNIFIKTGKKQVIQKRMFLLSSVPSCETGRLVTFHKFYGFQFHKLQ